MLALIHRAVDAERLTKELAQAEAKIDELESYIRTMKSAPSFVEVAKDFDVSNIHERIIEKVIADLSQFIEPHFISLLKQAGESMAKQQHGPIVSVRAATNINDSVTTLRFSVPPMETTVLVI